MLNKNVLWYVSLVDFHEMRKVISVRPERYGICSCIQNDYQDQELRGMGKKKQHLNERPFRTSQEDAIFKCIFG